MEVFLGLEWCQLGVRDGEMKMLLIVAARGVPMDTACPLWCQEGAWWWVSGHRDPSFICRSVTGHPRLGQGWLVHLDEQGPGLMKAVIGLSKSPSSR